MVVNMIPTVDLPGYDAVRSALVADQPAAVQVAAAALAASDPAVAALASAVATATELPAQRTAFAELSKAEVLRLADAKQKVFVYYCPMAPNYAYWLQAKPGLANPYMGVAMPECGEEVSLKVATKAAAGSAAK